MNYIVILQPIYVFAFMKKKLLLFIFAVSPLWVLAQVVDEDEPLAVYTVNDDSVSMELLMTDTVAGDTMQMAWPYNIVARLDQLVASPMFETSQLGMMVYDLTADSVLYRKNERQLMRPASTMKCVTAIAAIDKLGGSYQFTTSLYYKGCIDVREKVLRGDIFCVGRMDPQFGKDDMRAFVESVVQLGIDTIKGMIIGDVNYKEEAKFGEGWCWDDDNPVLTPLLISRRDAFLELFAEQLQDNGIVIEGGFDFGTLPTGATLIGSRSHSLDQILMKMMKDSNNLYAEALFYHLAAYGGNRPATAKHARNHINNLINKIGLRASTYKVADGSGLSLYNYLSAELEVALLKYAYRNSNIYGNLYPSFPIAGVDGTLKKRMRGTFAANNVRAKTGTLTGVSTLAGYCEAANGHNLCFAIMNQGVLHNNNGRNFQDRVCIALCCP